MIARSIDAHSLVGNIGGYVGLLLGFSIVQIPDILLQAYKKVQVYYLIYVARSERRHSSNVMESNIFV